VPLDLTDPKVVKALEKAAEAAAQQDGVTLANLVKTQAGRTFVWNKLTNSHVFTSIINDNPIRMAFNEGRRDAGLELLGQIMKNCPDEFILMMREANERDSARSAANESAGNKDGNGSDQGPDEQQLDFYRDLATGRIETDFGSDEAA
jgi:hypothetical protein